MGHTNGYYRYMAPLLTKKPCLKCHAEQGYREGEIRGGISVSIPSDAFHIMAREQRGNLIFFHLLIYLVGVSVIVYFQNRFLSDEIIIRQALRDRGMLIREMNHRVKNNLAIVQSILSIHSSSLDDEEMKWILMDTHGRVKAITLIHDRLYKADDLKSISVKGYLESLVRDLVGSFYHDPSSIDLSLEITDAPLDIEAIIP